MNSVQTKELAEKVLGIIRDIPDVSVEKLVAAWDSGTTVTKYNLEEIMGISGQKVYQIAILVADPTIDHSILKAMFVTGLVAKSRASENCLRSRMAGSLGKT